MEEPKLIIVNSLDPLGNKIALELERDWVCGIVYNCMIHRAT